MPSTVPLPGIAADTAHLKHLRNRIVGNPTEKKKLAVDDDAVALVVDSLNVDAPDCDELRIAAANIVASLATGSYVALQTLLDSKTHQALLYALSRMPPTTTSPSLRAAFARALRALGVSVADAVGPSWWALGPEAVPARESARIALEEFLNEAALDVYLPLLLDRSPAVVAAVCGMLAHMLRVKLHRLSVSDWLPPSERGHEHKRAKRGWETVDIQPHAPRRQGGWVTRHLVALCSSKDRKVQEAALYALAAVSKENVPVAKALTTSTYPDEPVICHILHLAKSRSVELQLAACFCVTQVFRTVHSVTHSVATIAHLHPPPISHHFSVADIPVTLVHILNQIVATSTHGELARGRACFILSTLVSGEHSLVQTALECGSLTVITNAVVTTTPPDVEWEDEESSDSYVFREALFSAATAITLLSETNRQKLSSSAEFCTALEAHLHHPCAGVRHAACLCVRAISRSVHILRTAVVDAKLGPSLFELVCRSQEDRRVRIASLAAMCNLITNEHSPARAELINRGGIDRLIEFVRSKDEGMRVNAAWAIANCLYKATHAEKKAVMDKLTWPTLRALLNSANDELRENSLTVLTNYASPDGLDVIEHVGREDLTASLESVLGSVTPNLICRGFEALVILIRLTYETDPSFCGMRLLARLREGLGHKDPTVRRAAAKAVTDVLASHGQFYRRLRESGVETTLRVMHGPGHIGHHVGALSWQPGMEEDADVRRLVSDALVRIDSVDLEEEEEELDALMVDGGSA